jgi:hypothetical protein
MKTKLLVGALGVLLYLPLMGQEIQITNVNLKGDLVEVHYNLLDERIDRSYSVNLYTSKDNFIQPMEAVKGDRGVDIAVGENKVLIWNAKEEFGEDFDGAVSLELKGNFYVPFITLDGLETGKEFKRGQANDFIWSGGRGDNVLNFELYNGDNLVKTFEERPNIGNTALTIPASVKPGDNYRYRISDTRNRDEVVFTNTFIVKRKYPLGAKIGAAFVIGVGVGILIKSLIPEKENVIAIPPLPEGG